MNRKVRILTLPLFLLFFIAITRDLVHGATAAADPVFVGAGDIASAIKHQSEAVSLNPASGQIRRQLEFFQKEAKAPGIQ